MKEDFLHYIWQFKKFNTVGLRTVQGEELQLINNGQYLQQSGPDFFNAQIALDGQKWAGNVEIHLKSSDWYIHHHETDPAYDNVILHVVWEHDLEVMRPDGSEIPVLELASHVDEKLVANYNSLASAKTWIYCEKELGSTDSFTLENWKERLFFERLERKAAPVAELSNSLGGDWEAVLFCFLAKNFGLNTNGEVFFRMAQSLPFHIVRKESFEFENLEALFFGRIALLDDDFEEHYPKDLQFRYRYITGKYQIKAVTLPQPEFFRHRPDNFPTIRLSQLAALYHSRRNLFDALINAPDANAIYDILNVQASAYWQNHYRFDKESPRKRKPLSKTFADLIIINTIVPLRFAYSRHLGKDPADELIALLRALAPEKNAIIERFNKLEVVTPSAYDTQAMLQLRNEYCGHKRCMQCAVGLELLKK